MSKVDELLKSSRGIASESMGRPPAATVMNRASAPAIAPTPDRLKGIARSPNAAEIPIGKIDRDPDQPREEFDPEKLARLASSLRACGQLQPIRVRWDDARARYIIVCGERRWRAAEMAGLTSISCVIMEGTISPAQLLSFQLVENMVREDLTPIEQAKAFRAVMDMNGWSTHDVARELTVDQSSVVRALKLLDLPAVVQERVERGDLPPATAYEVSKLDGPEAQAALATRIVTERLSRDETVQAVRRASTQPGKGKTGKAKAKVKDKKPTTRTFRTAMGAKVTIEFRRGLDARSILAALQEAVQLAEGESQADDQVAA
jgi:ParB family chromosome partitioning protein